LTESGTNNRLGYLPDISLFLCTIVWGFSFTAIKDILGTGISTVFFIFARFGIASLLLYPFCRNRLPQLSRDGVKAGILLGLLLFAGFVTQTSGLLYTTASKSAFITGLSSVFIPIFLFLHRGKLPEPLVIMALLAAALGLYLLTGRAGGGFNYGDFLTLICAVAFGAQIYLMGIITVKYDSLALTFIEVITMTALSAAVLPFERIKFVPSAKIIWVVIVMAIIATAATLLIQAWAQKRTSAVRAGLLFCAEPVFAYMFAWTILGERFNLIQKIGGAVIILAIVTSELVTIILGKRTAPKAFYE
jgi:drug/metabolite transporter (DMT)-like permease